MTAIAVTRLLRAADSESSNADQIAVLGRDIRISPERIARYCVTQHALIYEDLATVVESIAYWDRLIVRRRSEGWTRHLPIEVPVYELGCFRRASVIEALTEAARFLTGDRWDFHFVAREGPASRGQGTLDLPPVAMKHVVPFSDGLDSFAQVQLSVCEHGRDAVMLVRSGLSRDRIFPGWINLRVPRKFGGARKREVSYRTRPLVFYSFAAIAAVLTNAEAVVIGENGQGSIGPACLPFSDEWWFRSAHPAFIRRWSKFLGLILDKPIQFEQPQLWRTKGEVLSLVRDAGLIAHWEQTNSCSTRPKERLRRHGCGICGGCILRTVAAHTAGLPAGDNAFDLYGSNDIATHRDGSQCRMTPSERAVAVRAIAAMVEFANFSDSPSGALTIQREAQLIEPNDSQATEVKLRRLLQQHQSEWNAFMSSLPNRSWVRDIVGQL
jgi:7-cyano-7-deazaguanine synthase in queuosine biosynthesis